MGALLVLCFLVGVSLGSFVNCLVYRVNHDLSPFQGRSFCPKCQHPLAWRDNIPLLAFVFLKGRCRYCHQPISIQYPLVELVTGLLLVLTFQSIGVENFIVLLFYCFIVASSVAIFVSDWLYFTIPDEIVYPAMGITILYAIINHRAAGIAFGDARQSSIINHFLSGLIGALFFFGLVLITRSRGMGLGDVKLAGLTGLVLGYPLTIVALYLAFLTGALVGVILIMLKKKKFGEKIPFGPFLAGGMIIILILGEKIWPGAVLP